ncbi:MAG: hypothetical protein AAFU85_13975 [Planctomycetota bacterium]
MSTSDVRSIESLQRLKSALLELSADWKATFQEVRVVIHRADEYFTSVVPTHWREQTRLAERELTEAKDELQRKQSAARAQDRPSALEAQKRVRRAKQRLDLCLQKRTLAKSVSIEMSQQCDELLGPLADMMEHSDNYLPAAAQHLGQLIDTLLKYADASGLSPTAAPSSDRDTSQE